VTTSTEADIEPGALASAAIDELTGLKLMGSVGWSGNGQRGSGASDSEDFGEAEHGLRGWIAVEN
jgi:hypothetical protein